MATTTSTNTQPKAPTLEDIQKAMKAVMALGDFRKKDKELGIQAMNLKFNHPEDYRKLDDEDKTLIDNAIERAAYIQRQETMESILNPIKR